ncbi:uncharacterized protein ACA1_172920 [Acanthamoeba castellanii str. Neff]|uniref:Tetratricopeptide repeat domain containing protein n=1 Tax=Acanthamoeba castellanii (strain ATCC 30010 / Neff) TaxID=1257118 RepID=L8HHM3_ACACF|nr:uncharacterized protein ACA1_172920 [Acanthamoeba castellanii str. Neff]ELR24665.1 hypothetical protein ACA1_172920 [Acanthamoeba castellanii str. Neff]
MQSHNTVALGPGVHLLSPSDLALLLDPTRLASLPSLYNKHNVRQLKQSLCHLRDQGALKRIDSLQLATRRPFCLYPSIVRLLLTYVAGIDPFVDESTGQITSIGNEVLAHLDEVPKQAILLPLSVASLHMELHAASTLPLVDKAPVLLPLAGHPKLATSDPNGRINAIANALKEAQAADDVELQRRTDFETARKSILARTEGDWLQDLYDLWQAEIEALRQHSSFAPQSITAGERTLVLDPEAFVLLRALLDFYKFTPGTATSNHGLAATKGYLRYLVQTSSSSLPEPVQRRAVEALDKFRRQFEQQLHCRTEAHTWHVLALLEELMYDAASISQRPKTDATQAALRVYTEAEEALGELPAEHIFNVALLHMILSPTDANTSRSVFNDALQQAIPPLTSFFPSDAALERAFELWSLFAKFETHIRQYRQAVTVYERAIVAIEPRLWREYAYFSIQRKRHANVPKIYQRAVWQVKDEEKEAMLQEYLAFEREFGGKPELTLAELRETTLESAPPGTILQMPQHAENTEYGEAEDADDQPDQATDAGDGEGEGDDQATDLASESTASDLVDGMEEEEGREDDNDVEEEEEDVFAAADNNEGDDDADSEQNEQQERREKKRDRDEFAANGGVMETTTGDDPKTQGPGGGEEAQLQSNGNGDATRGDEEAEGGGSSPKRQRVDDAAEEEQPQNPATDAPTSISDLLSAMPNLADFMQMVSSVREEATTAAAAAGSAHQHQQLEPQPLLPPPAVASNAAAVGAPSGTPATNGVSDSNYAKAPSGEPGAGGADPQAIPTIDETTGAELPLSLIEQLVTAITDPVIVEIVRSLEKIQILKEQDLANRRREMKQAHEQTLSQLKQQHTQHFAEAQTPEQKSAALQRFVKELHAMEAAQTEETKWFDGMVLKEFDKKITEQQTILQQASVPGFSPTADPAEMQRQARVLELILALGGGPQLPSAQLAPAPVAQAPPAAMAAAAATQPLSPPPSASSAPLAPPQSAPAAVTGPLSPPVTPVVAAAAPVTAPTSAPAPAVPPATVPAIAGLPPPPSAPGYAPAPGSAPPAATSAPAPGGAYLASPPSSATGLGQLPQQPQHPQLHQPPQLLPPALATAAPTDALASLSSLLSSLVTATHQQQQPQYQQPPPQYQQQQPPPYGYPQPPQQQPQYQQPPPQYQQQQQPPPMQYQQQQQQQQPPGQSYGYAQPPSGYGYHQGY